MNLVAQISNLLYRRPSRLRAVRRIRRVACVGQPADWKSAIQEVGNLRYACGVGQLCEILGLSQHEEANQPADPKKESRHDGGVKLAKVGHGGAVRGDGRHSEIAAIFFL